MQGALLPEKFPEVLLRVFQLVLKEPSPVLHPESGAQVLDRPAPGTRASLVQVFPSVVPTTNPLVLVLQSVEPAQPWCWCTISDPRLSSVESFYSWSPRIPVSNPPISDPWSSLMCVFRGSLSKPHWLSRSSTACPKLGSWKRQEPQHWKRVAHLLIGIRWLLASRISAL